MKEAHVIYLPANTSLPVGYADLDSSQYLENYQSLPSLSAVPLLDSKIPLIVLVPGQKVLMTETTLPRMNDAKMREAVRYALEDELVANIDQQYFAIGVRQPDGKVAVGVLDKQLFLDWLAQLKENDLYPSAILPDYLSLAYEAAHWSLAWRDNWVLVRQSELRGFAVLQEHLLDVLQMSFAKHKPEALLLLTEPPAEIREHLAELVPTVERFADHQKIQLPVVFNLLQGEFKPRKPVNNLGRNWWVVLIMLLVWLGVFFVGRLSALVYLDIVNSNLQQQIDTMYKKIFPQATQVLEPRFRVQGLLRNLRAQGKGHFLSLLQIIGNTLTHDASVHLISLTYVDDRLDISLSARNLAQIQRFTDELQKCGLQVKQKQVVSAHKRIAAELEVTQ